MAFEIENDILLKYTEEDGVTEVVIPEGVTEIGDWAFWECKSIRRVRIPEGVTRIGDGAFYRCENMTSVMIPERVTSIEKYAFAFCDSLTDVTISESVTSIGIGAFIKTPWLEEYPNDQVTIHGILLTYKGTEVHVTIPENVTRIGAGAFYECERLQSVVIPDSVTWIGNNAFDGCRRLRSVVIPDSVTWIGNGAFDGCRSIRLFGIEFTPRAFRESDYTNARKMLQTKNFSMKISTDIKYAAAVGFWLKTEDEAAESFIRKSISRIMPFLIGNDNMDVIHKLLESGKFITKKNVDKFIGCAIEHTQSGGSPEIQTMLLHYKGEAIG